MQKLKAVSGDLLDLWLFEGSKGLKYVQETKAYQYTDQYVNYYDKFEQVKAKSGELTERLTQVSADLGKRGEDITQRVVDVKTGLDKKREDLAQKVSEVSSSLG